MPKTKRSMKQVEARALEEQQEVEVTKTTTTASNFSRPNLLTLNGLYSTTKALFNAYVPASAANVIKGVSQTLFKASTPLVIKALPESASSEWKSLESGELESLDNLFVSYLSAGDLVVDSWVHTVFTMKNFLFEKAETVKPEIQTKIDEAKAVVQAKMEDEKVVAILDSAKPYINLVKENVDPARDVISEMATSAKAEVDAKGYVEYAKQSAGSIREQGLEAFETCKSLGAVEGVKEISGQVMTNVSNKLEDAKKKRQPVEKPAVVESEKAVEAEEAVVGDQPAQEEFTSASEDDTN